MDLSVDGIKNTPNCWASALGNCSDKGSREHVLSKGLFPTDEVFVQGLSWCKSDPKLIGINAFTAKILCTRHNNELSRADDAGIGTADTFREAFRLFKVREKLKPKIWTVEEFRIEVRELERWFLKTLINVACDGDCLIGRDGIVPGQPSRELVEIAFGQKSFRERAGFYLMAKIGEDVPSEDRVSVTTVSPRDERNRLVGAKFKLQGFSYFLCLDENGVPEGTSFVASDGTISVPSSMFYRHAHFKYLVHKRVSHIVHIE